VTNSKLYLSPRKCPDARVIKTKVQTTQWPKEKGQTTIYQWFH
jgi:hypothetical protein